MIKLNDFLDEVFSFLTKLWFVFCGQRCYTRFSNYFTKEKKIRFVTPFKWWWSFILHVVNKFSHMLKLQAVYEVEITRILTKIVLEIMLFGRILGIVTWCIVKYLALTLQKLIEWTKGHFNQKCQYTDKYLSVKRQVTVNDSYQQTKYYWPVVTTIFSVNSIDKRSFHEKKS